MSENNKNNAMTIEEQIWKIDMEINGYLEAVDNAEGALAEAEREMNELLAAAYEQENLTEPYPDC